MEPNQISEAQKIFIGVATVAVAAIVVIALILHGSDNTTPVPSGGSSTAQNTYGGPVAKTRVTGLHGNTYYGQTIKFVVPDGIAAVQGVGGSETSDQIVFTLDGGHGSITSQPNDASMSISQMRSFYPGKKKPLEIADGDGFIFDQTNGSVDALTAIAYVGPQMLTIQLAGTDDQARLDGIAAELAAAIKVRKAKPGE